MGSRRLKYSFRPLRVMTFCRLDRFESRASTPLTLRKRADYHPTTL